MPNCLRLDSKITESNYMGSKAKPAPAPDFEMIDSEEETVRLSDFKGKRHIILVFNRGFG